MSVLEIMIGLCIAAILAVMLVPNWQALLNRDQDEVVRYAVTRFLQRAYREANLSRQPVIVCQSQDQATCGGEWQDGMLMYQDSFRDGELHDASQIIARFSRPMPHHQLHARFYPHYHHAIHFNPVLSEQTDNGSFWYCHANAAHPVWVIRVNKLGINRVTSSIPESYHCR